MDIEGTYQLDAGRETVWQMLNDVDVLRRCIPGCESLETSGENQFAAKIMAAVGPVKARFNTDIALADLEPPVSYTISGSAKSGAAGFGRGSAKVTLTEPAGGGTQLHYVANLKVGGKLAQIGSRMVVGATRKTADDFFGAFADAVHGVPEPTGEQPARVGGRQWLLLIAVLAALIAAAVVLF
ncbi:MAG: carbon monoxide dehydrogenase subunit G [Pseudomonadota bacterium]